MEARSFAAQGHPWCALFRLDSNLSLSCCPNVEPSARESEPSRRIEPSAQDRSPARLRAAAPAERVRDSNPLFASMAPRRGRARREASPTTGDQCLAADCLAVEHS